MFLTFFSPTVNVTLDFSSNKRQRNTDSNPTAAMLHNVHATGHISYSLSLHRAEQHIIHTQLELEEMEVKN